MGKLAKIIVLLAIIAVAGYVLVNYSYKGGSGEQAASDRGGDRPRLEEKYGFTTESAGD